MSSSRPMPKEFEGLLEPDEIYALQNEFLDETAEELERVMNALAAAEYAQFDQDSIHQLFRAIHSLKGSASVFGYDDLSRLSHSVESCLAPFRKKEASEIAAHLDDLLFLVGLLLRMVRDGKVDRMNCAAAEAELAFWIDNSSAEYRRQLPDHLTAQASVPVVPKTTADTTSAGSVGKKSALIADSARTLHDILHRFLEPYHISWIDCQSGAEVIERCAVEAPSILFLGYVLPDMNTSELLAILNQAGIAPSVIVVISSLSEEELRKDCPYRFTFIQKDHTLLQTLLPFVKSLAAG
ncbi:MAG: Hpt domain-containing protein [Bacteroidota bacterium]